MIAERKNQSEINEQILTIFSKLFNFLLNNENYSKQKINELLVILLN